VFRRSNVLTWDDDDRHVRVADDPRRARAEEYARGRSAGAGADHEHVAVAPFDVVDRLLPACPVAPHGGRLAGRHLELVSPPLDEVRGERRVNGNGERGDAQRRSSVAATAPAVSTSPAESPNAAVTRSTRAPGRVRNPCGASATGTGEPCSRRAVTLPIAGCPEAPTTMMAASPRSSPLVPLQARDLLRERGVGVHRPALQAAQRLARPSGAFR
jgi:hypothetical protein